MNIVKKALYGRVSTEDQAREGVSIDEQQERLIAYCKSQGWSDYELYIDDGYSAKDTNRPAFQRMVDDIRAGEVDGVVTTKIDRLTRRLLDLLNFTDFLNEYNCFYKSTSEAFDTSTAAGRMVLQLLGVFAEFERERIAERVKDNMHHLAKQGKPISRPCFGYDLIDKKLVINEEESKWVQRMSDMYLSDHGTFQIAKMLNENHVLTKNGGQWSAKAVRVFLENNQMLIGNLVWNKQKRKGNKLVQNDEKEWIISENTHSAILDQKTFDAIQEKLEKSKMVAPRSKRSDYLLSGLVRCGHCGARMIGTLLRSSKNGQQIYYPRYICSGYQKKGLCFNHWIYSSSVEPYVLDKLIELTNGAPIQIYGNVEASSHKKKIQEELQQTRRNLRGIDEKSKRQLEAYEAGVINLLELKEAKERLKGEKAALEENIRSLEESLEAPLSEKDMQKFIHQKAKDLKDSLQSELFERQQNAVRELIHEVQVFGGKEIQFSFNI